MTEGIYPVGKPIHEGPPGWLPWAKGISIILLLFIPLILTVLFFKPFITDEVGDKYTEFYRLPDDFTKDDLIRCFLHMQDDPDFSFYFATLTDKNVGDSVAEVYQMLREVKGPGLIYDELMRRKSEIDSLAAVFNHLDFPEEYYLNPAAYPDLSRAFWHFIHKEFQLTVMGLFYKANHDLSFRFDWAPETKKTARKVHEIAYRLSDEKKRNLGEIFTAAPDPS